MSKRNPPWTRDELILALDVYMRHNPSHISPNHPEVVNLSQLLNKLPIHTQKPDIKRFRNPNSVHMKLRSFLRLDPAYSGKGLQAGGKLEEEIWEEFHDKRDELHRIALGIRSAATSKELLSTKEEDDEGEYEAREGRILTEEHKARERNRGLVRRKKQSALRITGKLICEACSFDFEYQYGALGRGIIECHHIIPLSNPQLNWMTRLSDLALVCPNCHRILHTGRKWISIEELRSLIKRAFQ